MSRSSPLVARRARLLVAGVIAFASALAPIGSNAAGLSFGVYGDMPYMRFDEAVVAGLIEDMNREPLAFVVHVGDFKSGMSPCTDEMFESRRELLLRSRHPLVVVPGDNDWTDCHRAEAGRFDPLERLDRLRALFHAGDRSLGERTLALARQSSDPRFKAYRENTRWSIDGVLFVTLNVPGSNNNLGRTSAMDEEHRERMRANEAWLADSVRLARRERMRALVVLFHADPRFHRGVAQTWRGDGFAVWRAKVLEAAALFAKPMLVIHGDGHRYRIDQPLRDPGTGQRVANLTRLEVFGFPETNWVRVTIPPDDPARFEIHPGRARFPGTE